MELMRLLSDCGFEEADADLEGEELFDADETSGRLDSATGLAAVLEAIGELRFLAVAVAPILELRRE